MKINSVQRNEGAASIVTATDPGMVTGDRGTVSVPPASSFNGDVPVIKVGTSNYVYASSGPDIAPSRLANQVTSFTRSGGTVTLKAATTGLSIGTYVVVHIMNDSSFNGIFRVTAVNTTAGTFTYAQSGSDVATTTAGSGSSWPLNEILQNPVPVFSSSAAAPVSTRSRRGHTRRSITASTTAGSASARRWALSASGTSAAAAALRTRRRQPSR